MSNNQAPAPVPSGVPQQYIDNPQSIFDLLAKQQQQLDKMMVLKDLMDIKDMEVSIGGEKTTILNQEVLTEYTNAKMTQYMVKIGSWEDSVQSVLHLKSIKEVPLVPKMRDRIIITMKSHKRKGSQEVVNALRNEVSGTEVIPSNQRRKKFFGIV